MNLQSRTHRWLKVTKTALATAQAMQQQEQAYRAAGRPLQAQAQDVVVTAAADPIQLIAEADPPVAGTNLAATVGDVITAASTFSVGPNFRQGLDAIVAALETAVPQLARQTQAADSSIDEIISELERSLLVSLIVTLTSHSLVMQKVEDWRHQHRRFLEHHRTDDYGHYFEVTTFRFVDQPGSGRVHMQHLISAVDSGAHVLAAGATDLFQMDHYPEIQSVAYAQWFVYIHAIWEEQFRDRIAASFSLDRSDDEKLEKNDVKNDLFGDIRWIRDDFVHNKGIVNECARTKILNWGFSKGKPIEITVEQMLSLIGLFPREELLERPTRQTRSARKNLPGSGNAALVDRFVNYIADKKLDKATAVDEMLSGWLEAAAARE
jgi:hypothetical protein